LDGLYEEATRETIEQFEATGSPVITDGEQRKYHNFWTYSVHGLVNTAPDGFKIPFSAGHVRRMPRLTAGPFRYKRYADRYLDQALRYAQVPLKQAVIAPSALSLMYPAEGIPKYSREAFLEDLVNEHVTEVRRCLDKGAHKVQIDFTEGRLAVKIDPTGNLLGASSISITSRWRASPPTSASASVCTPAREVIATPPTAPMWTMQIFCRAFLNSTWATSILRWPASTTASMFWRLSANT
jgi:methionine synthase II (cobalamin-independent)